MDRKERIGRLREYMESAKIDICVVPTADYHQSEYVGEHFKARAYMSGFTGSQGTLIVTLDDAALWTDGRYFIQAADQLRGSTIELFRSGEREYRRYISFWQKSWKKYVSGL